LTRNPTSTAAPGPAAIEIRKPEPALWFALLAYAGLVLSAIYHHEPWADEAQAWLLARDASLWNLWTHLLHYEGSPGLWQTLLHVLIGLRVPYATFSYVPALFACAGTWVLLRYSPFPLAVRLLLPFTFFLGYQYAVVARSYSLLPPLLFLTAMLYGRAERHPAAFGGLLCLMATVSAHGMIVAGCVAASFGIFRWRTIPNASRRNILWAAAALIVVVCLAGLAAIPAKDVTFVTRPKLSVANWYFVTAFTLQEAFTGQGVFTFAAIILSVPLMWRGRGLLFFALCTAALCTFGAVVYAAVWHQGVLVLAWLFALWISAAHLDRPSPRLTAIAWSAVAIVVGFQGYWTYKSIVYDWGHSYSAGAAAAKFIREAGIDKSGVYLTGYATTAIQPYFPKNLTGNGPAYWDWSKRNRLNDPTALIASRRRDYVVAGYKLPADRGRLISLMSVTGYDLIRSFEGNLFWHAKRYEAESFDIYRYNPHPGNLPASSSIPMNDPAVEKQLIAGFYGIEASSWRWTAKRFSAVLRMPTTERSRDLAIRLSLFIPEIQIQRLGPMTLHAEISGRKLPGQTFSHAGPYKYIAQLSDSDPPRALECIDFSLDKATPPTAVEARELGVVVTAVEIEPVPRR